MTTEYVQKSSKRVRLIILILFVIAAASIVYNVVLSQKIYALQNPQATAAAQVQQVVAELSKFMILPTNETPSLATVSDLSGLKGQPFFANAQVGDQVLVYINAKRAILWRPSEDIIVEVAPIVSSSSPAK